MAPIGEDLIPKDLLQKIKAENEEFTVEKEKIKIERSKIRVQISYKGQTINVETDKSKTLRHLLIQAYNYFFRNLLSFSLSFLPSLYSFALPICHSFFPSYSSPFIPSFSFHCLSFSSLVFPHSFNYFPSVPPFLSPPHSFLFFPPPPHPPPSPFLPLSIHV